MDALLKILTRVSLEFYSFGPKDFYLFGQGSDTHNRIRTLWLNSKNDIFVFAESLNDDDKEKFIAQLINSAGKQALQDAVQYLNIYNVPDEAYPEYAITNDKPKVKKKHGILKKIFVKRKHVVVMPKKVTAVH